MRFSDYAGLTNKKQNNLHTQHVSTISDMGDIVIAHLFCHPKVSVFCQGQALYFVKLRLAENKLTPPIWRRQFQI
jgi:hypothetical protein